MYTELLSGSPWIALFSSPFKKLIANDKYLYSIDFLGRKTSSKIGLIIDIYESGKSIKKHTTK